MVETYILSLFNYGDALFQNISGRLSNKIQRVQNSCMRFVFGLRKYDHISSCYEQNKTLNMENRRKMHALIVMHKISIGEAPEYLSEKIVRHSDLHDYNTRGRDNIAAILSSYHIIPILNENLQRQLPVSSFKIKCKKYLTNQQFPHLVT